MLPIIVKLLFSKLVKKKGVINKNSSINDRRNVVYIFLSSLDPATEFPLFFEELLEPLNLVDLIHDDTLTDEAIKQRLVAISFNQYATFINTVEIIFKQLGTLMSHKDFLGKLSRVLTLMLSLSKQFNGHLKEQAEDDQLQPAASEDLAEAGQGAKLYQFVGKQSKTCMRRGLKVAKQLVRRFSYNRSFTERFSALLYRELVADQLSVLKERYISEKSQLVEILTICWSSHANCLQSYLTYPDVLPSVISMLQSSKVDPDNVQCIMTMLKNIVQASLDSDEERDKVRILSDKIQTDDGIVLSEDDASYDDVEMAEMKECQSFQ